jgi:nicotinamide mononucleotide transporter PnuC
MKFFSKNTLTPFDWFLIIGIISLNIIYSLLMKELDILGSIAGITGVACVVLVAKRSISNYIFGVINVSIYAYIAYKSRIYGDFILNAFYYFPMQFIGWYGWMKHMGDKNSSGVEDKSIVKSRRMNLNKRMILFSVSLISVIVCGFILDKFTLDPQPYKDAATTILSIIAQYLMVRMFMEQWFLWVMVNLISVIMWSYLWYKGAEHAALMVCMWIFYLANSINGLIVWNKATKK